MVPPYDIQVGLLRAFSQFRRNALLWEIIWSKDEFSEIIMELYRAASKLPLTFHFAQTKIFTSYFHIFFV